MGPTVHGKEKENHKLKGVESRDGICDPSQERVVSLSFFRRFSNQDYERKGKWHRTSLIFVSNRPRESTSSNVSLLLLMLQKSQTTTVWMFKSLKIVGCSLPIYLSWFSRGISQPSTVWLFPKTWDFPNDQSWQDGKICPLIARLIA